MKKLHIIAVLILCALFISCSSNSIVGKWKRSDKTDVTEFTSDGKIALFDEKGQKVGSGDWSYVADTSVSPYRVTINDGNANPKCIYKIEGNKLILNCPFDRGGDFPKDFSDKGAPMTFERK